MPTKKHHSKPSKAARSSASAKKTASKTTAKTPVKKVEKKSTGKPAVKATKKVNKPAASKATPAKGKAAVKASKETPKKATPPSAKTVVEKKNSATKPSSAAAMAPIAQVSRIKVQRPHAFTIEDVEELLKSRGDKATTASATTKTASPKTSKKDPIDYPPQKKQSHSAASLTDILGFNPQEKLKPEERALADIPKKFHKHYKDLQKLRAQVQESLEFHTEETLNRSAKEDSGDLSGYGQHQADAGTDNYDRDYALSLVSDEQELLFEIEEAIKRIHQGTYGICEVTGKPINKERLNAVPFARYSLEGQIEFEKTQRRHTQRRGIFDSALEESSSFGGDDDTDD